MGSRPSRVAQMRAAVRQSVFWARRYVLPTDAFRLISLSLITVTVALIGAFRPHWVTPAAVAPCVLVGGILLSFRSTVLLVLVVGFVLAYDVLSVGMAVIRPGSIVVVAVTCLLALWLSRSRARLGVYGTRGESMLVDLRDRLRAQGEMPALPRGWETEVVLRPAGGASFSGDFVVASLSRDGKTLEIVLVDVSGKGVDAGTRALLLSGAFGGLLGAMPGEQFLPAANAYLIRQNWEEGFATAIHLAVDLVSGKYVVTTAGHPPLVQFVARSGRWRITGADGPLLGLLPDAEFAGERGELAVGDALLIYTDGLVEVPGRDLSVGIDRLIGEAERLVTKGFRHGARKLIDSVSLTESDDRALVLVWRA
jgi:Stage II sporulation protein E (SpoIIE)